MTHNLFYLDKTYKSAHDPSSPPSKLKVKRDAKVVISIALCTYLFSTPELRLITIKKLNCINTKQRNKNIPF